MGLDGRVAMVTGAARGIGEAIARALVADGAAVAICDINGELAAATAADISKAGGHALAVPMDITDGAAVRGGVERITAELGPIDILVNNAGWDKAEPFVRSSEETWDKVIAINLKGPIHCARAVIDGMTERGRGRIISIASDAGRVGSSGEAVYSACKGGIIAFSKTLARELARNNVTVNCICPGPTDTALFAEAMGGNPRLAEALSKAIPMRRLGQPQDIAPAVVFLASDGAGFITGQTLSVSGGLTMS